MARPSLWTDEYWLLLMQLYLKKPVGVKPIYSRGLVGLSLELHIRPQVLYEKMLRLRQLDTPQMEQLWAKYSRNPKRLSKEVKLLRQMNGFGQADQFYEGVEVTESFERDFKPLAEDERYTPVMLVLILDLYFRLTPQTMVAETPEVAELARLMKLKPHEVADIMEIFQTCDPYLNRNALITSPLQLPCMDIWRKYADGNPEQLAAYAAQLKDYFR